MARGPPLLGLLLLLLGSEVHRATSSPNEDNHGQYVNGSYKMNSNGSYTEQPSKTGYQSYALKCGRNEHWDPDSQRCVCNVGYCKSPDCPEFCELCSRCENHKSPGPGSTGISLPKGFIYAGVGVAFVLLVILLVVCYKCRDQLHISCAQCISDFQSISYFRDRTQPQGQVHDVAGPDPRNGFELPTVPVDVNGQYKPEETHSLLPGGNSDSVPDSAISVVREVMPQSGSPETPPPA